MSAAATIKRVNMAIEQLIQAVLTASPAKRRELEDVLKGKAAKVAKGVFSPASWERFKSMWEKGWNARRKKPPRSESCGGFKFP